ncbi:MAG: ketoacyl-ACP synthase III [Betaproteobacteria bacterium]|jgi:3-oxoacyl-[acyl-carrier-protein] synthase-3|uniref:beta-ketoacyl-ACP synthase III n=1 Tax=unclassified Thiomonas TaxID=2625466 RepID=UPI000BC37B9B|nr:MULTISPECIES: beta-ketoacyl-ACP synthase III [unclassified Thiomonas]MDE2174779.1 ketoacyl-ACP synthase III [Betaproteobacteria bacterium]OZB71728.1 MAG: 3-oxoacyl-ACP synthase [Thiomonas sp. 13-64-67]
MSSYSRISGTGSALPPRKISNDELAADLAQRGVETSDEWIVARTGIRFRHFAEEGTTSVDLGEQAARRALESAGLQAHDIGLIIVATSTPDMIFPSNAALIQGRLGAAGGAAFDVQAVCAGFVYALAVADQFVRSGMTRHALVIGAEVFSQILDFNDRTTCVLFGDGAGAVVLSASEAPGVLASALHADGRQSSILCTPGRVSSGQVAGSPFLKMDGQAVFKQAVHVLEDVAREALAKAERLPADVDWMVPHQANIRIMTHTAKKLGIPLDKIVVTVDQHGNTSAASIPLALDVAVRSGQIQRGDTLLFEAVGGGLTWGAAVVDY